MWDSHTQKEIHDIQILGVQFIIEYQGMWFAYLKGNSWHPDLKCTTTSRSFCQTFLPSNIPGYVTGLLNELIMITLQIKSVLQPFLIKSVCISSCGTKPAIHLILTCAVDLRRGGKGSKRARRIEHASRRNEVPYPHALRAFDPPALRALVFPLSLPFGHLPRRLMWYILQRRSLHVTWNIRWI